MRAMLFLALVAACAPAAAATLQFDGAAERFLPGIVSKDDARELQATVNGLEKVVLFGCEDCVRKTGTDLFTTVDRGAGWTPSGRAPLSRRSNEALPSFSSDGYWLYYVDDRKGGFGGTDLMRSHFRPYRGTFSNPELLQGTINSPGDEGGAAANENGGVVIFASRGRKGAKGWDLWLSRRKGGRMTEGERLDGLNSKADEFDPALLAGDAGLVFARSDDLAGGKPASLWFAPREGDGFGKPVKLGDAVNAPGSHVRGAQQDWSSPRHLLFTRDGDVHRIAYDVKR